MKCLLILSAVIAVAYGQHWNGQAPPVQDTPEVAAAKAAHFAAIAREQTLQTQSQWNQPQNQWNQPQNQWNQPPQNQWNHQPQYNEPGQKWYGPLALPPGYDQNGAPLPVQDTPEVAAEKAKHFSLVGGFGAQPAAPQWNQWNNAAPQQPQWNQWNNNNNNHGRWRRSAVLAAAPLAYSGLHLTAAPAVWSTTHLVPAAHYAHAPLITTASIHPW